MRMPGRKWRAHARITGHRSSEIGLERLAPLAPANPDCSFFTNAAPPKPSAPSIAIRTHFLQSKSLEGAAIATRI
jgi:hypothetical protein